MLQETYIKGQVECSHAIAPTAPVQNQYAVGCRAVRMLEAGVTNR